MSKGVLFLVLPENGMAKIRAHIHDWIVPDERRFVQVFSDAAGATFSTDINSQTARDLIDRISGYPKHDDNKLVVGHEARCSFADLSEWWKAHEFGNPNIKKLKHKGVIRFLKEHLEQTGQHWRVHAETQLQRFDGQHCNLDTWMTQFGVLGCSGIGRRIAAKLRVIRTAELPRRAFAITAMDEIGQRQGHCYVQDEDPGGSWVEMQAILTHACPTDSVFPVRWDKKGRRLHFPEAPVDEFVIYEDGLWSGSEAVRRLHAMADQQPPAQVTFRFGVVTDFGLMVTRQAIRSLDLAGCVSIDTSGSELIRFLKRDIPETLRFGLDMPPHSYFQQLHKHVEPFAFSLSDDWTAEEISTCEEIGTQLVCGWLSQHSSEPPSAEQVGRFALGGGRFASTVVFSRSIPKVCLPLLWLDGPVKLGDRHVNWRPLLVDARRVSDGNLLLS